MSRLQADYGGFMVGYSALWVQVVLVRRLIAAFSGNELSIGIVLAAWMIWSGAGAFGPGRLAGRLRSAGNWLAVMFIAVSVIFVPLLLFSARIKPWLGAAQTEVANLPILVFASFILAFPLSAILGFAFNLAAAMQEDFEKAAGRAYRFEALGAFLAGIILAIWFGGESRPLLPALCMSGVLLFSAVAVSDLRSRTGRLSAVFGGVLFAALVAGLLFFNLASRTGGAYEKLYWGERQVAEDFDSRHGYLAAIRAGDQVTIYEDGSPSATFPDAPFTEVMAHVPLVMHPSPKRVLLVGGGLSGMGGNILLHPVAQLDYLQQDPGWVELERRFTDNFAKLAVDPRVNIETTDARVRLRHKANHYDVVIINLPDPLTADLNRFYTIEFFEQVKRSLRPGGVLALTAGSTPPNLNLTEGQLGLLAGVSATVEDVFDKRVILPLGDNLIVAGDAKARLFVDAQAIQRVLDARGIDSEYASGHKLGPDLDPYFLEEIERLVDSVDVRPDRDLHPKGYIYGTLLWAERASPSTASFIKALVSLPSWSLLGFPVLVLAVGAGWVYAGGGRAEAGLASGVSGFCAIVVEVALMISFQVLVGAVYFALSILTAAFMIGLAGGALLQEKLKKPAGLLVMEAVLFMWCAVALGVLWGMTSFTGGVYVFAVFSLLLFAQGVVAGALFYSASRSVISSPEEVGSGVGLVYGLELFGSAGGGLLAGVLLVPVFGILGTMLCATLCAAAALAVSGLRRSVFNRQ